MMKVVLIRTVKNSSERTSFRASRMIWAIFGCSLFVLALPAEDVRVVFARTGGEYTACGRPNKSQTPKPETRCLGGVGEPFEGRGVLGRLIRTPALDAIGRCRVRDPGEGWSSAGPGSTSSRSWEGFEPPPADPRCAPRRREEAYLGGPVSPSLSGKASDRRGGLHEPGEVPPRAPFDLRGSGLRRNDGCGLEWSAARPQ